ncbi:MAG: PP0621 family protein [Tepidimonas sp.]|uniref:PP0621 family protein n=1 Tax=Tepidimonas sp. TaxID=2002775 RepID=UPI00405505EF
MFKWLVVIAAVVLGYAWWRHQRRQDAQERAAERARHAAQRAGPPAPGAMVRCRHCGVYLPAADAVRGGLGPYCCDEHRRLAEG